MTINCIAICGSRHQEGFLDEIAALLRRLSADGVDVCLESRFFHYLESRLPEMPAGLRHSPGIPPEADLVASIGGDGTFLRTARLVADLEIPILGINTGHLGFLANYSLAEAASLGRELCDDDFSVESRSVLRVEAPLFPESVWPYALNEVAILKEDTSSMITVHTELDGYFLADYLADGLIVATPTGSTGYNLSVGGPILQPTLECRVLSPIAPHSLTMRPVVVDAFSAVTATTTSRAHTYRVSLDGRSFVMACGTTIKIVRAPFSVKVLHRRRDDFASTLRHKLLWGRR